MHTEKASSTTTRILCTLALVALALCAVLVPKTAWAAAGDVYIGDVKVSAIGGTVYLKADLTTGDASDYVIKYEPADLAATEPHPARITIASMVIVDGRPNGTSSSNAGIYAEGCDLEVNAPASTTFTFNSRNASSAYYGICVAGGNLTFSGSGTLTVNAVKASGGTMNSSPYCAGIYADGVVIESGCTVEASGSDAVVSYGVSASGGGLTVQGSTLAGQSGGGLTGTGGSASQDSYGICVRTLSATSSISVQAGATLAGTGGVVSDSADGPGESYGVYCFGGITATGTIAGTGGAVTRGDTSAYAAGSYGVCAFGAISLQGTGGLTGTGGAATASSSDAVSIGVCASGTIGVGNGDAAGSAATLTGTGEPAQVSVQNQVTCMSCGVQSDEGITVNSNASLRGTGGIATAPTAVSSSSSGVSGKTIIVKQSGTLEGFGKAANDSRGIETTNNDAATPSITVAGTITGTGEIPSSGGFSVGISTMRGKIALSGTMTATAKGDNTASQSIGVLAGDGIDMTEAGELVASTASTTKDVNHCAKVPKTHDGSHSLTTSATAMWRSDSNTTFEQVITYADTEAYKSLHVMNRGRTISATPDNPLENTSVTLTASSAEQSSIRWYRNTRNAYEGAETLATETQPTLTVTATRTTTYYYCEYTDADSTKIRSNIVAVTGGVKEISLSPTGLWAFSSLTVGYAADKRESLSGRVSNTGNQPTGDLEVSLSGENADKFELSRTTIPSIAAGGSPATFTVKPVVGLTANGNASKRYTATVTVGNANVSAQSFNVRVTVVPAPTVTILGTSPIVSGTSTTLTADVTGGVQPYAYRWSTGETTPSITVSPTTDTTYTVVVTDFCDISSEPASFEVIMKSDRAPSIEIAPGTSFTRGASGGDYEVTIGKSTARSSLGAANLSGLTVTKDDGTDHSPTASDRDVRDGSIVITLHESYLNRLPAGTYTLTASIAGGAYDGYAPSTTFQVVERGAADPGAADPGAADPGTTGPGTATKMANTGDGTPLACGLFLLAGAGIVALAAARRRNAR